MNVSQSIRDALFETFLSLLSPDTNVRSAAEQRIKAFEVTDDYGSHLTDIVLSPALDWPLRQLAAVLLKQYIITHWTSQYEKFEEPEVSQESKSRIRSSLISSLGQECDLSDVRPEKKLKSAIAYAVYAIGHYDWPEEWPDLMMILISYVTSGNPSAVYGSMKVFVEICHEITETQMPSIAPLLLPKMLQIIQDNRTYSVRTRGRAVQVLTSLIETLAILQEMDKKAAKTYLDPLLNDFIQTLIHILQLNDSIGDVDVGLRKDIVNCLTILLKHFPKRVSRWMTAILQTVWNCLTSSAIIYVNTIVNSDTDYDSSQHDYAVDSDGEILGLEGFIFSLFEFISILIESSKTRNMIKQGISDLIYYILMYIQITDEQVQVWSMNPDQFVEDEDEDTYSFNVRLSSQDVLLSLATEFEESGSADEFRMSFISALKKHLEESDQIKNSHPIDNNNSHANWWKIQESCLFALGSLSESFVEVIQANDAASLHVKEILDQVLRGDFLNTGSPFFAGRCLWTAARFAPILPAETIDKFLQVTVASYANPSPVIKISAIRATYSFSSHLKDTEQQSLMKPYLSPILDGLLSIGIQFSSEVLALVLETICILITIDPEFTGSHEHRISPLAIATFIRNSSDPVLISCCQNIFRELSKNEKCIGALQSRLGPTINSILSPSEPNATASTLQPAALDILTSMVRASNVPLSDILMQLFCSAVNCILSTSDDNSCLQNGGECIRAYVSKSTDQVMSFNDRNGVQMVMRVCLHLLDPRVSESCSAFVGRLVSISIGKAAAILAPDNVHLLLRSVLSKLQTAETLSVIQSLVMVFAHLIHYEMQTVLDFLSSIPGPTGAKSALEFLLNLWLSRQHLFFGNYEKKVSILALGKLLQHSVLNSSGDASFNLNVIQVPGDPILDEGIQTRSKTKCVEKWTQVPCSVKILKVILAEVQNLEEQREICSQNGDEDDEEEDEDETDETIDDQESQPKGSLCFADHQSFYEDEDEDDDEEEVDEDELLEIKEMNLANYLSDFIHSFKETSYYSEFLGQLNESEQKIITSLK